MTRVKNVAHAQSVPKPSAKQAQTPLQTSKATGAVEDTTGASGLPTNLKRCSQFHDSDDESSTQKSKKVKAPPVVEERSGPPLRRTGMWCKPEKKKNITVWTLETMILSEPDEGGHNPVTSGNASNLDTEMEDDDTPRGNKRDAGNYYIPTQLSLEEGERMLFTSPMRKIIKGSAGMQTRVDLVQHMKERKTKGKQAMRDRVQAMRTQHMTPGGFTVQHVFSF
jgi:hypothetical protein